MNQEIINLTQQLLDAIAHGDWETYENLCDANLTAFEPEAHGHLVNGLGFHKFYFENQPKRKRDGGEEKPEPLANTTISAPHVRMIGDSVAIISYVRLIQKMHPHRGATTKKFEETRVWERRNGKWIHVHFHRSKPGGQGNWQRHGHGRQGNWRRKQLARMWKMRKHGGGRCK